MALFDLNPNQPLNHFEYAPVQAQIAHAGEQDAFELGNSVEALSALQEELAIYLANLLSQLHQNGCLKLSESSLSLHFRENEQAMIKSNLRLFLEQIAAAFKGLSGFGSHAAAVVSSNRLLTVKVEEDIDPLESAKMKEEMEVDGKDNETEFEDYLVNLKDVFDELSMGQILNKVEMDSQFLNDLEKAEEIHRLKEEKNEQGRQSILKFIVSIETATQTLLTDKSI
ncbi:hypothetical protein JCM5353_003515 [Sporobolomyces roseus]